MPIIDLENPGLAAPIDTPKGFAVTPGAVDVDHGQDAPVERPAWSSTMAAAFRQDNTVGALFSAEDRDSPVYKEPGFNPWDAIKGTKYEPQWGSFTDVRNTRAADDRKRQIDQETEDKKTLAASPWYQRVPSELVAGGLDIPTLLPGGAFVKGVNGGVAIAKTAGSVALAAGVSSAAQEAALQNIQATREMSESVTNVGASVLLGGVLGAAGARLLSSGEWAKGVEALHADIARAGEPVPADGGAQSIGAAAHEPAGIEGNSVAGAMAGTIASATSRINPALRILESPSAATREIGTGLFENSVYLKKNMEGVASEPAVETLMKEWNGGLAKAVQSINDTFPEYRKGGGDLTNEEFREAVGKAMRRGDKDPDPYVQKVAEQWRSQVFDPLKDAAIKAGLLPKDVSVETAESYFSRMWNKNKLIAQEGKFKGVVSDWIEKEAPRLAEQFDKETIEGSAKLKDDALRSYQAERRIERESRFEGDGKEMARDVSNEVFNTLTGKTVESGARPEFITVKARGPLKERTFNIPDHLVEDFLESDVEHVGRRYARVMGADVELANKYGSVDMKDQIAKIREDYAQMRSGLTDEKQLTKLGKQETADVRDIEALRDLLRGTRQESPLEQNYSKLIRSANHVNYIRSMGEVVLASLTDTIRPAMVHGLMPFIGTTANLATNMKAIKMSVHEAQLAGNVTEAVLGHRLATLSEIGDPYAARGPIEAFLENMTNVASKWNGIRMWTDGMKSVASVMTQNRILKGVESYGSLPAKEKAYLAYLGIDQSMAERIAEQYAKHGENLNGVRVANTEKWGTKFDPISTSPDRMGAEAPQLNPAEAVAIRTFRAAINKDVDSIIIQKSVADVPLFASTPTGKMVLQFKSFTLASHQKILLRGLQEDQARFLGGVVAMTAMGMFQTWLKTVTGNRFEHQVNIQENPGWWIGEGLDRSGVVGPMMEVSNAFEKIAGINPIKAPIKAFDVGNAMSQKNQNKNDLGAVLGPTFGLVSNVGNVLGIPQTMAKGEEVSKAQKNSAVQLMPFNSYFGVRQIMNYFVNPPQ